MTILSGRRAATLRSSGRHARQRVYRFAGRSITSGVVSLALLCAVGFIAASGAATGALWKDNQPVNDGLVVTAGDLDIDKCAGVPLYWENTDQDVLDNLPPQNGGEAELQDYHAMPGDKIKITQCVELTLSGDNLATKLSVQWGNLTSGGPLTDAYLTGLGVNPAGSTYRVLPVGPPSQGFSLLTGPAKTIGTDTDVGIEPATFQPGPAGDRPGPIRWNVEITLTFQDLVPGPIYTPQPPIVNPTALSAPTADPVEIPTFTIVANQTRTTGEGF